MEIWTGVECASKLRFRDKLITSLTDLHFYDQLLLDTFFLSVASFPLHFS